MLDVKKLLTLLTKRSIHYGSQINLGDVTINANGWYGFDLGTSCPSGAIVVTYVVYWTSNTTAFWIPSYNNGANRTQYICGTPNGVIRGLKITPVYTT